jgi:glycosyltransferase involved in cell wall biosynthesis
VKVLVVAPYPPMRDGIGVYARTHVEQLRSDGHEVTVLSPPDGGGDLRAPFRGGAAFRRAARAGGGFDRIVVHFQPALYFRPHAPLSKLGTSYGLEWLALRRGSRLEVVVHEADPPDLRRPDYRGIRSALRRASQVSFHTRSEWEAFERDYRVRVQGRVVPHLAEPVEVVPAGVARRQLDIGQDGVVLVCAGFLQPSKGYDRAVEAFARATSGDPGSARLYVVGSVREPTPENRAFAAALAARCREVPGVTLREAFVDDPEFDLWLSAADRVVLPYRRAFSSGVLARAHAMGRPAVVSAVGGLAEQAGPADEVVGDDAELEAAIRRIVAKAKE